MVWAWKRCTFFNHLFDHTHYECNDSAQDVMKVGAEEVFQMAAEKLHPHLNRAFQDAGVPCRSDSTVIGALCCVRVNSSDPDKTPFGV